MSVWIGRLSGIAVVGGMVGFILWLTLDASNRSSAKAKLETQDAQAPQSTASDINPSNAESSDHINNDQVLLLDQPVPVFQTLTYWTGTHFQQIKMRVRDTSAPVTPNVHYTGQNPREKRRWRALARAAWFGALVLFENKPNRQVEFHIGRATPQPEALVAMMVATFTALHNRRWPEDVYFAGAITLDAALVPPPRFRRIQAAARSQNAITVPMGDIRSMINQNFRRMSREQIPNDPQEVPDQIDLLRQEISTTVSKLMAGQNLGLELEANWPSRMQRLEGRFTATVLKTPSDWFQLGVVGSQIRASRALTEFAAERLEPFAKRLRRRAGSGALTDAKRELSWFIQLVKARLNGHKKALYWSNLLPIESKPGKRFRLTTPRLSEQVNHLRELGIALRRALIQRTKGRSHPFPYPTGELSMLSQAPDAPLSRALPVDWGTWSYRSSMSWAQYVALITQQPEHASSVDVTEALHGDAPSRLKSLVAYTEDSIHDILERPGCTQLKDIARYLPMMVSSGRKDFRVDLTRLERSYFRLMVVRQGCRLLRALSNG
ncbi:MAG: hypothetical protein VX223_13735 [Myxococcota bacterium]|nr:hypothetical protein [Myxococcota bacterium]